MSEAKYYLERYEKAEAAFGAWKPALDEAYFYGAMIKNYTTSEHMEPSVSVKNMDSFAVNGVKKLAGIYKGMIFPSAEQAFRLKPKGKFKDVSNIVKDVSLMSERLVKNMDAPESELDYSVSQAFFDAVVGGNTAIEPKLNHKQLYYREYGVAEFRVDVDENKKVNSLFFPTSLRVSDLMSIYKENELTDKIKKDIKEKRFDKCYKVVRIVEPNRFRDKEKKDNKNYEYASIHLLCEECKILRKSGYHELPSSVGRMNVIGKAKYGRGVLIPAIYDIKNMSRSGSIVIQGSEFVANPAMGYYEGSLGVDTVDIVPGKWIPIDHTKIPGQVRNPIVQLFEVGDLRTIKELREEFKQEISDSLELDRLLDFNNQTQMTAQEARLRAAIRNQSNNGMYSNLYSEFVTPLITRSFNLAYDVGILGVGRGSDEEKNFRENFPGEIPEYLSDETAKAIENGEDFYEIEYLTEASRVNKNEKKQGVLNYISTLAQVAQVWPESLSIMNGDETLRYLAEQDGVEPRLLRTKEELEQIRQAEEQAKAQQAQLAQRQAEAQTEVLENEATNNQQL